MSGCGSISVYSVKIMSYQNLQSKLCSKVLIPKPFPNIQGSWINIPNNACKINRSLMCVFCQICIIKGIPQFLERNAFSIETIHIDLLSLKQLTSKTLALIVITSDRALALHLVNIKKMHIADA